MPADGEPLAQRFLHQARAAGHQLLHRAGLPRRRRGAPATGRTAEATLANNRRLATVDRGGGPYRVLYVGGRPNWEFKFLRRAIDEDDEVNLVGLVRIAKREPKFTFLGRSGERTNPLFRGFSNQSDEAAEQYDQPVLIRLGTEDKDELRGGFPQDADDLFRYHAIILDDIEAAFFKQDQLSLLQQFVSRRGGGLLMLGGKESFGEGGYQRTPVGEMLPVYLDRTAAPPPGRRVSPAADARRLAAAVGRACGPTSRTRPSGWRRCRRSRRSTAIDAIKPGASVLAEVETAGRQRAARAGRAAVWPRPRRRRC